MHPFSETYSNNVVENPGMRKSQVICFHKPNEENGYLSNWYLSTFRLGTTYSSLEQYMMHQKALCFHDAQIASKILQTDDLGTIKALGRQVSNYDDTIWNGIRQIIVYKGVIEKFRQNPELQEKLLSTKDALLAECAVNDRIWGIGLSMNDPARLNPKEWRGQNLLGFALMQARSTLKTQIK